MALSQSIVRKDYSPNLQDFLTGGDNKLSLRQCAAADALKNHGISSIAFNDMRRQRSRNYRPGKKTNVGDPCKSSMGGGKRK